MLISWMLRLAPAALLAAGAVHAQDPLEQVVALSAGYEHTCAIRTGGALLCWGQAQEGQLGNGASGESRSAVSALDLGGPVRAVSAGDGHTCAARMDGVVYCFGSNRRFELGTSNLQAGFTPVAVAGVSGVQALAAGGEHSCAINGVGAVRCWGGNFFGMLGNGSSGNDNPNPGTVSGLSSGAVAIGAGSLHSCALTDTGAVRCWGVNSDGQLGDGSNTMRTTPVTPIASGATAIAVGFDHSCALLGAGTIQCWGYNSSGQLGDGTVIARAVPVNVANVGGTPIAIGAGRGVTCAVLSDNSVKCWGAGPLGDGSVAGSLAPALVPGVSPAIVVAPGGRHRCVLRQSGRVVCWGNNQYGQIGNDQPTSRNVPVAVVGLPPGEATAIAVGESYSCAIVAGATRCWGRNLEGQLGNGTTSFNEMTPVPVTSLQVGTSALALAYGHACAIDAAGGARCWGANNVGQLGDLTTDRRNAPVPVDTLASGLAKISVGRSLSCALSNTGRVVCWGQDLFGQRGDGPATAGPSPSTVLNLDSGATALAVGADHACAVNAASQTRCWGRGDSGQLGNDNNFNLVSPVPVDGLTQVTRELTLGSQHGCAVGVGGAMRCWGYNLFGQLGDGTYATRDQSVAVAGLGNGVSSGSTGEVTTCAVLTSGETRCWGNDTFRVFGTRDTTNYAVPTPFPALGANVRQIAPGRSHGCAIVADGSVRCWGANFYGELGDGTSSVRLVPAEVLLDRRLFSSGFEL